MNNPHSFAWMTVALAMAGSGAGNAQSTGGGFASHPPIRPLPAPAQRALAAGPAYFVDAARGDDNAPGTKSAPWHSLNHALKQIGPGDTVYLRAGVYYENVYCAVAGRLEAPITIRAYPGERVIVDGGIPEFQKDPAAAWEPARDGAPGEFVSTRAYPNIRDVVGAFGDSHIGLQTYWHAMDLRASNELWSRDPDEKTMVAPVYCGPGLWYERETGRIHVRLAHTHIANSAVQNYRGVTDPRQVPLIVAPYGAMALFVDLAQHVHFQDLVFRGGGYRTIYLMFGVDVAFDNCTIFCGTYGIWAKNTGPFTMRNCGVHGNIPPWAFASENGLHTYTPRYYDPFLKDAVSLYAQPPGDDRTGAEPVKPVYNPNTRNIARLNTHAILVTEGGYEFETFYYPVNHDWDIGYCDFTDGHDGVYPNGQAIRFHHNWIDNIQDDGIYLSSPTPHVCDDLRIYQNLITRTASAFAVHSRGGPGGEIYVYRNVVDLRGGTHRDRPTPERPEGNITSFQVFLKHGRPFLGIESIFWYQNTLVAPATAYSFAHRTLANTTETTQRRSFNNLCIYLNRWPHPQTAFVRGRIGASTHDIQVDGNLHWCPLPDKKPPENLLEMARNCAASERLRQNGGPGWSTNGIVADPKLMSFAVDAAAANDYRLTADSPARGGGVALPKEWADPLPPAAGERPDIGAVPYGAEAPRFGRNGRIAFPISGAPGN